MTDIEAMIIVAVFAVMCLLIVSIITWRRNG